MPVPPVVLLDPAVVSGDKDRVVNDEDEVLAGAGREGEDKVLDDCSVQRRENVGGVRVTCGEGGLLVWVTLGL